jgi:regulator of sirC expression with transglutaminase-like and TPR domain
MKRRAFFELALLAGCARPAENGREPSLPWLSAGSEFAELAPAEEAWAAEELRRLSSLVRERARRVAGGDPVRSVTHVVFEQIGFVREVNDAGLRFVLLPSVLRLRRGSCVGLGTLLLALARLAGVTAHGVLRPGHFYVRFSDGGRVRNVEPLRAGEELSDSWYDARFPRLGGAPYYGRALTPDEVLGVLEYNIGNERKRERRWQDAHRAYARAVTHFPDFAEAHASLGTVLQVLGSLDAAERSYRRALAKNPMLPGLEWNLELLHAERANAG